MGGSAVVTWFAKELFNILNFWAFSFQQKFASSRCLTAVRLFSVLILLEMAKMASFSQLFCGIFIVSGKMAKSIKGCEV